jgi:hypothetical protein
VRHPVQQHLPQEAIQKTGLSVQAPSSTSNETIKGAIAVQQSTTELSETEEKRIMIITKIVLNLMKQNGC